MSKFDLRHNCLFGFDYIQYTKECTEMSSVDVRICVGIFGEAGRRARDSKTLPDKQ